MSDLGLTHIALPVSCMEKSIAFYAKYAGMQVIHRRTDATEQSDVVWLSDLTRPFVIVLIERSTVGMSLLPIAHLGVALASHGAVDQLCDEAKLAGVLIEGPHEGGEIVGYWAFLRDPDGHTLEVSYGQEINFTVQQANATEKASDSSV